MKLLEVVGSIFVDELWKAERSEVANSYFVLGGVLHDLTTEVGALDGTEILLIRFTVGMILVEHVWSTSFNLTCDDLFPKFLSFDSLVTSSFSFVLKVKLLKGSTMALMKSWSFIWTEKGPVSVFLDSLHEQIWSPESIEEITCSLLFLSVIFLEL